MFYSIDKNSMNTEFFLIERHKDVFCIPHIHYHAELFFVLDGTVQMNLETNSYILQKNDMAVVMPYEIHEYQSLGSSNIVVVEFPPKYIAEYKSLLEGKSFENPVIQTNGTLQALLSKLTQTAHPDIFCKKALIYGAFSELLQNSMLKNIGLPKEDTFRKAVLFIMEHYKEKLNLKKVSSAVGITPVHLSRMFGQKTDFCFTDLVNIVRLQEAVHLLQNTSLSISNIAFETGFGSIRNFNRIFEKFFNCTPTRFRTEEITMSSNTVLPIDKGKK